MFQSYMNGVSLGAENKIATTMNSIGRIMSCSDTNDKEEDTNHDYVHEECTVNWRSIGNGPSIFFPTYLKVITTPVPIPKLDLDRKEGCVEKAPNTILRGLNFLTMGFLTNVPGTYNILYNVNTLSNN